MAPRQKKDDTGELQVSIEQYTKTRDSVCLGFSCFGFVFLVVVGAAAPVGDATRAMTLRQRVDDALYRSRRVVYATRIEDALKLLFALLLLESSCCSFISTRD